jgi:hypothetical protein
MQQETTRKGKEPSNVGQIYGRLGSMLILRFLGTDVKTRNHDPGLISSYAGDEKSFSVAFRRFRRGDIRFRQGRQENYVQKRVGDNQTGKHHFNRGSRISCASLSCCNR